MNQTVSNCPFCSSRFLQVKNERRYFCVLCNGCGCSGPRRLHFNDAIAEWNALSDSVELLRKHSEQASNSPRQPSLR